MYGALGTNAMPRPTTDVLPATAVLVNMSWTAAFALSQPVPSVVVASCGASPGPAFAAMDDATRANRPAARMARTPRPRTLRGAIVLPPQSVGGLCHSFDPWDEVSAGCDGCL